jgi:hypothetical protein
MNISTIQVHEHYKTQQKTQNTEQNTENTEDVQDEYAFHCLLIKTYVYRPIIIQE